jgi:hypothetical protein
MTGAILTALKYPDNVYFFNLGSLMYAIWGWRVKEMSVFVLNAVLLVIYSFGCLN